MLSFDILTNIYYSSDRIPILQATPVGEKESTHIIATVADAPPGPLSHHQQVHLRLHWARAIQRLPTPVGWVPGVRVTGKHSHVVNALVTL